MNDLNLLLEYTQKLDILYVEDETDLQNTTLEFLSLYFKSVDVAENGEEGLKKYLSYFTTHSTYYDLVITDIKMPVMNGLTMSKNILQKNDTQAIIIITAYNEVDFLSQAIDIGINAFIHKPVNMNELLKVFYKTAQAICDHKLVEDHFNQMEALNVQLEAKNQELETKNHELEKSFRMLDTIIHKESLLHPKSSDESVPKPSDEDAILKKELIEDFIQNDLEELSELLSTIDTMVITIIEDESVDLHTIIPTLSQYFRRYASILKFYIFFDDLSSTIFTFSSSLENSPVPPKEVNIKNVFILLESFIYVLTRWHKDLKLGDIETINQFDNSIISDLHSITNMWLNQEDTFKCQELDDIFDF